MSEEHKKKKCDYCEGDGWADDDKFSCATVEEKELVFDNSDGHMMYGHLPINFCPWCGRKL